jgi:hypothetical protein
MESGDTDRCELVLVHVNLCISILHEKLKETKEERKRERYI